MSRQREKNRTSRAGAGTPLQTQFSIFSTQYNFEDIKKKLYSSFWDGQEKKGSWALSWHRGIFSLQDDPTHVFANLVHCLDINFTPFCCSAFPTVLTSTPPLYVLAADKHCEHLLHKMSGSWYLSSRCRDTTSNRIFSTNHKFEDKKE